MSLNLILCQIESAATELKQSLHSSSSEDEEYYDTEAEQPVRAKNNN